MNLDEHPMCGCMGRLEPPDDGCIVMHVLAGACQIVRVKLPSATGSVSEFGNSLPNSENLANEIGRK